MTEELMTPKQALDAMIGCHRGFYIRAGGEDLSPMYWLWRTSGEMVPVLLMSMPMKSEDRDALAGMVKARAKQMGDVYMFAFISEAWTMPPLTPEEYKALKTMPSQSDKRIEVITTLIGHRDGRRIMDTHELVRDWKTGKVVELKARDCHEDSVSGYVQSRFDLFAE